MALLSCFKQRLVWVPTLRGWIVLLLAGSAIAIATMLGLPGFLSPSESVGARVLVVEGWISDEALKDAAKHFRDGLYDRMVVTGWWINHASYMSQARTFAELAGERLRRDGFPEDKLIVLPSPEIIRDRTFTTTLAVKEWLKSQKDVHALDVFTSGAHGRRTRLLYQLSFGDECRIGIISNRAPERNWWKTSDGFREVTGELIAYLYARLIFRP
ncbi:MAG: hypothetical protein EXS31_13690 [Pedosphaera sp.]|nr:hypothetical protein [Pedosphaera sp.]